jgi:hypothetical protein
MTQSFNSLTFNNKKTEKLPLPRQTQDSREIGLFNKTRDFINVSRLEVLLIELTTPSRTVINIEVYWFL